MVLYIAEKQTAQEEQMNTRNKEGRSRHAVQSRRETGNMGRTEDKTRRYYK